MTNPQLPNGSPCVSAQGVVECLATKVRLESNSVDAVAYVQRAAEIREDLVNALKSALPLLDKHTQYRFTSQQVRAALRAAGVIC